MSDPLSSNYTIRRLDPGEAAGVARLVQSVYDDTYYPRDLYDPDRIVQLNEAGRLVSIVALDLQQEIVGHYALEHSHDLPIAEASDAIVSPDHRHHHLMEQMREALRREARQMGLRGVVGYPVTNHVFSQKADDQTGAHPCGLALGLWPRSFHNMPDALPQRMSFVIYFRYLVSPGRVAYVATHHREIIADINRQFDIEVDWLEEQPPAGPSEFSTEVEPFVETATIRVRRVGESTASGLELVTQKFLDDPAIKAINLELPLAQPSASSICRAAEQLGFYFAGLGPGFAGDGDALLLQLPKEEIDLNLLQVEHPFALAILDYIRRERLRIKDAINHCSAPNRFPDPQS